MNSAKAGGPNCCGSQALVGFTQWGEAKGCSRSSGNQHDTVWARSHEGVVWKAVQVGAAAEQSFWVPVEVCVSFFTEPVGERSPRGIRQVGTRQMAARTKYCRSSPARSVLTPPSSGTPSVCVNVSRRPSIVEPRATVREQPTRSPKDSSLSRWWCPTGAGR